MPDVGSAHGSGGLSLASGELEAPVSGPHAVRCLLARSALVQSGQSLYDSAESVPESVVVQQPRRPGLLEREER